MKNIDILVKKGVVRQIFTLLLVQMIDKIANRAIVIRCKKEL